MKEEMAKMKEETGKASLSEVAKRWKVESARRKELAASAAASGPKDDGAVGVVKRADSAVVVDDDDDFVESVRKGFSAQIDLTED